MYQPEEEGDGYLDPECGNISTSIMEFKRPRIKKVVKTKLESLELWRKGRWNFYDILINMEDTASESKEEKKAEKPSKGVSAFFLTFGGCIFHVYQDILKISTPSSSISISKGTAVRGEKGRKNYPKALRRGFRKGRNLNGLGSKKLLKQKWSPLSCEEEGVEIFKISW